MTFDGIGEVVNSCNCLDTASEDCETLYARRANKDHLRVQDMRSYIEMDKQLQDDADCDEQCSFHGVSITEYDDGEERLQIIKEIMHMAPKYKEYAIVFNLIQGAGMTKHTPIIPENPFHYDLYKSDEFSLSHIDQKKVIYLPDHV